MTENQPGENDDSFQRVADESEMTGKTDSITLSAQKLTAT